MTEEMKSKLVKVLKDNKKWPIILEGVLGANFPTAVVIPANIDSSELGVVSDETGLKYPTWALKIKEKSKKSKSIFVCINGIDELSAEEQEKFYGLIKYKGINGFKFPEGTQILIAVKDASKISKKIASLAILHKVG